jgi:hypothetical protein
MIGMEVGALLRETVRLMGQNGWRTAVALLLLTALGVFADVGVEFRDQREMDVVISVASLFLQTWLTLALLEAYDQRRGRRGVGTVLGIGLVSGLGILLGLVLLVVPGLILLVRWSISVPYALGEDVGPIDALQASFEETRGAFWPLLLVLLVCYAPFGLALGSSLLLEPERITLISSVVVNLLVNLGLLAGWHAAVAIYLARRSDSALSELFA